MFTLPVTAAPAPELVELAAAADSLDAELLVAAVLDAVERPELVALEPVVAELWPVVVELAPAAAICVEVPVDDADVEEPADVEAANEDDAEDTDAEEEAEEAEEAAEEAEEAALLEPEAPPATPTSAITNSSL